MKDIDVAMTKDKGKAVEDAKRRAQEAENARVSAEQSLTEMDTKLGEWNSSWLKQKA